jgi:hypothetical protein
VATPNVPRLTERHTLSYLYLLCSPLSLRQRRMAHHGGVAHRRGMVMCARMDYVGIGWLISASVGTVVHYSFYCHELSRFFFLSQCAASALLGTVLPFVGRFNSPNTGQASIAFMIRSDSDQSTIYSCTVSRSSSEWPSHPSLHWLGWLVSTASGK